MFWMLHTPEEREKMEDESYVLIHFVHVFFFHIGLHIAIRQKASLPLRLP
jgi:hypothetical protein